MIDDNKAKQQQELASLRAENAALKTQLKKYQRLDSFLKKAECLVEGLKAVSRDRSLELIDDQAAPPKKNHSGASNGETNTVQVSLSGALENSRQLSHSPQLLPEASVRSVSNQERLPSPVVESVPAVEGVPIAESVPGRRAGPRLRQLSLRKFKWSLTAKQLEKCNADARGTNAMLQALCLKESYAFLDGTRKAWSDLVTADGVHLSQRGSNLLGCLLREAIQGVVQELRKTRDDHHLQQHRVQQEHVELQQLYGHQSSEMSKYWEGDTNFPPVSGQVIIEAASDSDRCSILGRESQGVHSCCPWVVL
ncbi:hypothetical protein HPB52_024088 [Rhipicephalus sanguineus]|uniref:Uncharacterized protein n=1 Tax=Rhipicephalus sanguineus TaxID=34632 RepID=A0A9D4T680_RHISA|nr:hypothetical protein HPB52_024088 [Rhipicephalus sanguineus]